MTQVKFFILKDLSSTKDRWLYACKLIEQLYNQNRKIITLLSNTQEAIEFDNLLWTFSDISFIPHQLYSSELNPNTPIIINYEIFSKLTTTHHNFKNYLLINLTDTTSLSTTNINSITEIITNDELVKAAGRQRYQAYQALGNPLESFNVLKTNSLREQS
jgi:DNA polymerase III, chi subunit